MIKITLWVSLLLSVGFAKFSDQENTILNAMAIETKRAFENYKTPSGVNPRQIRVLLWEHYLDEKSYKDGLNYKSNKDTSYHLELSFVSSDQSGLQNLRFQGLGVSNPSSPLYISLPNNPDSLLIRQTLWTLLDGRFRQSVDEVNTKRAWLDQNPGYFKGPEEIKLPSRSQWEQRIPKAKLDSTKCELWAKKLTSTYAELDTKISSNVIKAKTTHLDNSATCRSIGAKTYIIEINNENSSLRGKPQTATRKGIVEIQEYSLLAAASWQTSLGTILTSSLKRSQVDAKLDYASIQPELDKEEKRVLTLLNSPKNLKDNNSYRGPVVFKNEAGGHLWSSLLNKPLESADASNLLTAEPHFLISLLGQVWLNPLYSVEIDSERKSWNNIPLYGYSPYDFLGRKSTNGTWVKAGRMQGLPCATSPLMGDTNCVFSGHLRYSTTFPSTLRIHSSEAKSPKKFSSAVQKYCELEGNGYYLEVESFPDPEALSLLDWFDTPPQSESFYDRTVLQLPKPDRVYKVSCDGKLKTPLQNILFAPLSPDTWRRMRESSKEEYLTQPRAARSIIHPKEVLIEFMDLKPDSSPSKGLKVLK
ncbi:hypothetical protein OAA91_00670 [Fibrobacterales bacterium]|nr:hypothetical protein [Fibrobacterales bacterium]